MLDCFMIKLYKLFAESELLICYDKYVRSRDQNFVVGTLLCDTAQTGEFSGITFTFWYFVYQSFPLFFYDLAISIDKH